MDKRCPDTSSRNVSSERVAAQTLSPRETSEESRCSSTFRPDEVVRASVSDAPLAPPCGGVQGMSHWAESRIKAQDATDYVSQLARDCLVIPPEELEEVDRVKRV